MRADSHVVRDLDLVIELGAGFGFGIAIEDENVALLHGVLLALGLDGCFHLK